MDEREKSSGSSSARAPRTPRFCGRTLALAVLQAALVALVVVLIGAAIGGSIGASLLGLGVAAGGGALASNLLFVRRLEAARRASDAQRAEHDRRATRLEADKARAEEASGATTRFLAAASHDLRQPLHAVRLLASAASAARSQPEREALGQRLEAATQTLGSQLDTLLDYARAETEPIEVDRRTFPARELIEAVAAELAPIARARGAALRTVDTSLWFESDPRLLATILRNLGENAIRHAETGRVLLGCKREGAKIRLGVWDAGPGIAPEDQSSIFRAFQRIHARSRGRVREPGLGLGLAIVDRLAARLGHRIQLASSPDRGSCFAVEVPRARRGSEDRAISHGESTAPRSLESLRVAILDDDAEVRRASTALLQVFGAEVRALDDPDLALEMLERAWIPDVVVVDWKLPGGRDGLAWLASLRERCGVPVPAILVTGDAAPDALEAARALRVPVLRKPVGGADLRRALERFVGD